MPIVQSFGALQAMTDPLPTWGSPSHSLSLYGLNQAYAEIYRTQPNVRICVDFLSRNTAQLPLQVFRRVSDTDRVRLVDHDLARWLGKPNPSTRRYRLIETLMGDLGIYFNAYLLKIRYVAGDGRNAIGLVRLPPEQMEVKGGLLPTHFCWTANGRVKDFPLSEIVYFNGYNPTNALMGLSPLETLRRILAEEAAAGDHREGFWRNAARHEGVVSRPKDVKRYTEDQARKWREEWQAAHAGGAQAGKTVLLQEGETFTTNSFSAKDSEYTKGGQLRREVCAAAYHIPQPMVGILDHATFSNIREQHKHTYQDCLGPWHEMIVQEFEGQLLTECDDQTNVYIEFNIDAKLAGTPEERATSLRIAIGRPWRTVNEGRALENLPRIEDPEFDTVAPQQGGPSDATAQPTGDGASTDNAVEPNAPPADGNHASVIHATRARQHARLAKIPVTDRPDAFRADLDRWTTELAADLTPLVGHSRAAATQLAADTNAATLADLEAAALHARLELLEQQAARPAPAVRRTFERDPHNGLVLAFTDARVQEGR